MSYKAPLKQRDSKVILLNALGKTGKYYCQIMRHVNPEKWTEYWYKLHDFHGGDQQDNYAVEKSDSLHKIYVSTETAEAEPSVPLWLI